MKITRLMPAFSLAIALTSCAASSGDSHMAFPPVTSEHNDSYRLSGTIIPVTEKEALSGNGDEAMKLFMHYEYYFLDHRLAMYWLQIAAEDGNRAAQRHLGEMMKADNDEPKHYLRADFWLQKAGK